MILAGARWRWHGSCYAAQRAKGMPFPRVGMVRSHEWELSRSPWNCRGKLSQNWEKWSPNGPKLPTAGKQNGVSKLKPLEIVEISLWPAFWMLPRQPGSPETRRPWGPLDRQGEREVLCGIPIT